MRQAFAIWPFASATRYGPFFAGYWNSLVVAAHGAKHCASELGSVTTAGGAAAASPADSSAAMPTAAVRYDMRSSFEAMTARGARSTEARLRVGIMSIGSGGRRRPRDACAGVRP